MQVDHYWGEDLTLGPTGDLSRAGGTIEGQQRVLRRLLTPARDLVFHPEYGGGLPSWVGETLRLDEIESLIVSQIHEEAVVADDPRPEITLRPSFDSLFARIKYVDAITGQSEILSFNVNE